MLKSNADVGSLALACPLVTDLASLALTAPPCEKFKQFGLEAIPMGQTAVLASAISGPILQIAPFSFSILVLRLPILVLLSILGLLEID